jgi:hypothetical protein
MIMLKTIDFKRRLKLFNVSKIGTKRDIFFIVAKFHIDWCVT